MHHVGNCIECISKKRKTDDIYEEEQQSAPVLAHNKVIKLLSFFILDMG